MKRSSTICVFIGMVLVIAGSIANQASAATVVASNDADIRGPASSTDGSVLSVGDWNGSQTVIRLSVND